MPKPPILSKSPAAMKASVVKPAIMESSPASRGMQGKLSINTGSLPKSVMQSSPTPTTPEMMNLFKTLKPRPPPITERSPASRAAKPKITTPSPASQASKQLAAVKKVTANTAAMRNLYKPKKKKTTIQKTVSRIKRKLKYGI